MHTTARKFRESLLLGDLTFVGETHLKRATPTYYLTNFSQKLRQNEEILAQRGRASLAPPTRHCEPYLRCENRLYQFEKNYTCQSLTLNELKTL